MSRILFGDFKMDNCSLSQLKIVQKYTSEIGVYFWFDKEVDFYNDVQIILKEQTKQENKHTFCITTELQPTNSDDLLFPYYNYSTSKLFPNGDNNREQFNEYCKINLEILRKAFSCFLVLFQPKGIRVFITEGYDNDFKVICCDLEKMIQHIYNQIITSHILDSTIYLLE